MNLKIQNNFHITLIFNIYVKKANYQKKKVFENVYEI